MREIKFRAYSPKHDSLSPPGNMIEILEMAHEEYGDGSFVKQLIWQQYIGVNDKNGKEIYEGDILWAEEYNDDGAKVAVGIVAFDQGSFELQYPDGTLSDDDNQRDPDWWDMYEIIGNIYENRDLLEVNHAAN